jgi:hypothetical protein
METHHQKGVAMYRYTLRYDNKSLFFYVWIPHVDLCYLRIYELATHVIILLSRIKSFHTKFYY